jgi:hypothetical protein
MQYLGEEKLAVKSAKKEEEEKDKLHMSSPPSPQQQQQAEQNEQGPLPDEEEQPQQVQVIVQPESWSKWFFRGGCIGIGQAAPPPPPPRLTASALALAAAIAEVEGNTARAGTEGEEGQSEAEVESKTRNLLNMLHAWSDIQKWKRIKSTSVEFSKEAEKIFDKYLHLPPLHQLLERISALKAPKAPKVVEEVMVINKWGEKVPASSIKGAGMNKKAITKSKLQVFKLSYVLWKNHCVKLLKMQAIVQTSLLTK